MFKDVSKMLLKLLAWFVVAFLAVTFFILQCSPRAEGSVTITDVIYAIEEVESNRNPHAINTHRKCVRLLTDSPYYDG